jgi:hypothetical protein
LIKKIASEYRTGTSAERYSAGLLGFWQGVRRYNHLRNSKPRLGNWCKRFIRAAISDYCRDTTGRGEAGETRLDRWICQNAFKWPYQGPKDPDGKYRNIVVVGPECSLTEAEEALERYQNRDMYNSADDNLLAGVSRPEFGQWSCFKPYSMAPHRRFHDKIVTPIIDDLARRSRLRATEIQTTFTVLRSSRYSTATTISTKVTFK